MISTLRNGTEREFFIANMDKFCLGDGAECGGEVVLITCTLLHRWTEHYISRLMYCNPVGMRWGGGGGQDAGNMPGFFLT